MFAVMNDPSLSSSQRTQLLATYFVSYGPPDQATLSPLLALVPIQIKLWAHSPDVANTQTQQEFGVRLWPHWRAFPPAILAGNGLQYMFYVMGRASGTAQWKIQSEGTGP